MKTTHKSTYVLCSISVLVFCLSVAGPGMAQVSKKISYQGYLQDSLTGTPVTGTVQMEFALYDVPTGGSPLWSEAQQVDVNDGRYSVHLGAVTPLNLTEVKPYYLRISIDGEVLIDNSGAEYREELTSGLYSLFSGATGGTDFPIILLPDSELEKENTFYGGSAGENNSTGRQNTFIGHEAGLLNESGVSNTFIGDDAGQANVYGVSNTFVGHDAGRENRSSRNTFVGDRAGMENIYGTYNTFVGHNAGRANTTGYRNTFVGDEAGQANTTGYRNTFVGRNAGRANTTGHWNTFVGDETGQANTTGRHNTFVGDEAGQANEGSYNTFVGGEAGRANSTGGGNTFLGENAGEKNKTGAFNTFVGNFAGWANTDGSENTYVGNRACQDNHGSGNVCLGYEAGFDDGTTSNKLYIQNSRSSSPLISGDFAAKYVIINGHLFYTGLLIHTSDQRLKDVQQAFTSGLETIEHIQPVLYRYKAENPLNLPSDRNYVGVLAQEVRQVLPEAVEEGEDGYLMVNNEPILWTMLNAIKELKAQDDVLKAQNETLKSQNEALKAQNEALKARDEALENALKAQNEMMKKEIDLLKKALGQ